MLKMIYKPNFFSYEDATFYLISLLVPKACARDIAFNWHFQQLVTTSQQPGSAVQKNLIKDFILTKEDCSALKTDQVFEDLSTIMWSNLNILIEQLISVYHDTLQSSTAFNNIIQSLEMIRNKKNSNIKVCLYVLKCINYLKQEHIRKLFEKKYESRIAKFQVDGLKKKKRLQGEHNTALITYQAGVSYLNEILSASETKHDDRHSASSNDAEPSKKGRTKVWSQARLISRIGVRSVKFWKEKYSLIAAELKLMLERLVHSGVEDPEVYGLLIKGGVLEIYMMDIKVDGIYRFVEVDTVNLVTNFTDMLNLMRTLPILYQLKERALTAAKRLESVELQKSKGIAVNPTLPVAWFRTSMDPKMKAL